MSCYQENFTILRIIGNIKTTSTPTGLPLHHSFEEIRTI